MLAGPHWIITTLSDGEAAESLHREAIERLARISVRVQFARAYSSTASGSGASAAFAERSQRESLATGEHARKRSVETRDELTPKKSRTHWISSGVRRGLQRILWR